MKRFSLAVALLQLLIVSRWNCAESGNITSISASNATKTGGEQFASPVTCGPRIRKSWDLLSPIEQDVYLRALARAMDDGFYIKFVEIHTEQMTTAEAHRTCMFIYWHRLLLLGFENMLRSYGGEFSCITIPYWNYVDHNALFLEGACASMEECSPILRALGGSTAGRERSVVINGTPVQGTCVGQFPLNHFCEASHLRPDQCSRCVPRGRWSSTAYPPTATVSSLMRQLFATPTIAGVATNIERGIHNTIHNALDGAMGFLEAPADPIFFSHHATLDLLHSIYFKCVVGNGAPIPIEQQLGDPRIFASCPRREQLGVNTPDNSVLRPLSSILVRSGEDGVNPDSVFDPMNELAPFFAGLPTEYIGLADLRNLGTFSYNYELTGLLADMFTTCAGPTFLGNMRRLESESMEAQHTGSVEAVILPSNNTSEWYGEAFAAALNASIANSPDEQLVEALEDVEKMTCVFYDECRGGVQSYTKRFRRNFKLEGDTNCRTVVDAIKNKSDRIQTPGWRDIFQRHFVCETVH